MPLDPMILMMFGAALILMVVVYQQPRIPDVLRWIAGARDREDQALRPGARDVIGWVAFLLGLVVVACGMYLAYLAG